MSAQKAQKARKERKEECYGGVISNLGGNIYRDELNIEFSDRDVASLHGFTAPFEDDRLAYFAAHWAL